MSPLTISTISTISISTTKITNIDDNTITTGEGMRPRAQIACIRTRTRTPARQQRRASPSSSSRRAA